jgi:hypothetical protein
MTIADTSIPMASTPDQGSELMVRLDVATCYALLAAGTVGRVVYTEQALPAIRPVTYALDGHHIVFRVVPGSALARAVTGQVVAFEVDHLQPDTHSGWSVVMIGVARAVDTPGALIRATALGLAPWAGAGRDLFLTITPGSVTGRSIGSPL